MWQNIRQFNLSEPAASVTFFSTTYVCLTGTQLGLVVITLDHKKAQAHLGFSEIF